MQERADLQTDIEIVEYALKTCTDAFQKRKKRDTACLSWFFILNSMLVANVLFLILFLQY